MKKRDKLVLTGAAALIVGLGAAATLMSDGQEATRAKVAVPDAPVMKDENKFGSQTMRRLAKIPSVDEVPQEFKEAENYLLDRWGHMEDAGLTAPGIMPEGDMYFQDRRILRGLRGNGKPVYAKAYLRPEVFRGPIAKAGGEFTKALDRNPSASMPGRTDAQAKANILKHAARAGTLNQVLRKGGAKTDLSGAPGSGFRERGQGASTDTITGN